MPFPQGITVTVPGISLPGKTVTLKVMNNLNNGVTIKSFNLPGNDPAGGIHLTLDMSVTNVSLQVAFLLHSFSKICWIALSSWYCPQWDWFPSLLWKHQYWASCIKQPIHPGAAGHVTIEFDWPPCSSVSTIRAFGCFNYL